MTQPGNIDPATARLIGIENDIREGRTNEATAALKAFNAAYPTDVRALLFDALIARAQKKTTHELRALHRATTMAPKWPRAFLELALALSRENRHAEALTAADTAVTLAPGERPPLETAIAVANNAGNPQAGLAFLRKAHALWPDDIAIDRQLGVMLTNLRRHDEADAHWRRLLAKYPEDSASEVNYSMTLAALGRSEQAVALLERAQQREPENAIVAFYLASARGETPATQPPELVQGIFDGYADYFDHQLVGQLKYRVPRRVAEIIRARGRDRCDLLDLGCGTGLLGVYLGKPNGKLVGVDLSPRMLERARRHGIYAELKQGDLLAILHETPRAAFDIVASNDVFIYVGDLAAVIPACFEVLRPGGALIFSCETADDAEGDLVLRPSKRYAHSRASIEAL
ncbi:MAG: methyltransferase domain-containing protein, partial [Proteobacteria bacterium]|nr:methyltransferase domain-containing protein [Pseudomonadota bacterium]